jgi:hypothetical protein
MPDEEIRYTLNEFQARPRTRRWLPKIIAILAVFGGIYGAAIGSAVTTTAGAVDVIAIAAVVLALLCGVPGAQFGFFFGVVNRIPFGRLFVGTLAAMGGAILGGFLGVAAVMPLGAILGAVGGWFFTRAILRRGFFRRLLGRVLGLVLGACIGATVLALQRDQAAALVGIAWGMGIGAVVGPMPLLLFIKALNSLPRERSTEGKVIDATVLDVPHDQDSGTDP